MADRTQFDLTGLAKVFESLARAARPGFGEIQQEVENHQEKSESTYTSRRAELRSRHERNRSTIKQRW